MIGEIEEYGTMYMDVAYVIDAQAVGGSHSSGQSFRNLLLADEFLFGVVRDRHAFEIFSYRKVDKGAVMSSRYFFQVYEDNEPQAIPPAKGTFEMPFDRNVAEVFARPSQQSRAEIIEAVFERLHSATEDDPLSWLASEPILQAAEQEGWDVVAVLPDRLGWSASWLPTAPGHGLSAVLVEELGGWAEIVFDPKEGYLSIRPQMPGLVRRSRINRGHVVAAIEALKKRKVYLEPVAEFYEWRSYRHERQDLLRLLASSIEGLPSNALNSYDDDAMMLLGSMSSSEQRLARRPQGLSISVSQASPSFRQGLRRLVGRNASRRLEPQFDGDGKMLNDPGPAILAFLTSDPARTTLTCKIFEIGYAAGVQIEIKFPSGETLRLEGGLRLAAGTLMGTMAHFDQGKK